MLIFNFRNQMKLNIVYKLFSLVTALIVIIGHAVPEVMSSVNDGAKFSATEGPLLSLKFSPAIVTGLIVYPDDPLRFDLIIDVGDEKLQGRAFEDEARKMAKYFLASLTVPEDELWVNLSPYERDRVIPERLGLTELGRDLLSQDYLLKQITSSLMCPESGLGGEFWERVRQRAYDLYGTAEIPADVFNKVWIVPQTAVVYEHANGAFVGERYLKVMLEEDYMAVKSHINSNDDKAETELYLDPVSQGSTVSAIIKEVILPELERDVNEGKDFAVLRQIYNSMILAAWYKQVLQGSLLSQVYIDQNKVNGIDLEDKGIKDKIYQRYVEAFSNGVFDLIKEDYDQRTRAVIPRRYFSGGMIGPGGTLTRRDFDPGSLPEAEICVSPSKNGAKKVQFKLSGIKYDHDNSTDPAMLAEPELLKLVNMVLKVMHSQRAVHGFGSELVHADDGNLKDDGLERDLKIYYETAENLADFILNSGAFNTQIKTTAAVVKRSLKNQETMMVNMSALLEELLPFLINAADRVGDNPSHWKDWLDKGIEALFNTTEAGFAGMMGKRYEELLELSADVRRQIETALSIGPVYDRGVTISHLPDTLIISQGKRVRNAIFESSDLINFVLKNQSVFAIDTIISAKKVLDVMAWATRQEDHSRFHDEEDLRNADAGFEMSVKLYLSVYQSGHELIMFLDHLERDLSYWKRHAELENPAPSMDTRPLHLRQLPFIVRRDFKEMVISILHADLSIRDAEEEPSDKSEGYPQLYLRFALKNEIKDFIDLVARVNLKIRNKNLEQLINKARRWEYAGGLLLADVVGAVLLERDVHLLYEGFPRKNRYQPYDGR
jgi:hypothetical protein